MAAETLAVEVGIENAGSDFDSEPASVVVAFGAGRTALEACSLRREDLDMSPGAAGTKTAECTGPPGDSGVVDEDTD